MTVSGGGRRRNFIGAFKPDPGTAVGRVMTRVCIGTDSRQQLIDLLRWEISQDTALQDAGMRPDLAAGVVAKLIEHHNEAVPDASPMAYGLITALEELAADGIVFGFGEGIGVHDSLDGVVRAAEITLNEGGRVDGYCFSTVADVERMIFEDRLFIGFGVFNEDGSGSLEIGERVARALRQRQVAVEWPGDVDHRIQVVGQYEIPYVDLPD
ncbi:DUF6891 domain-containing protein [Rudaeicoccus suwonensis]|uniref:DUF6891 domain-containing protein n=1 Tax=Rudaeicoccus suwonensis TaxID=657409 RepID=UPI00119DCF4D|nr:hypothetical protein [Rudaeicoccus suwonensis]